MGRSKRSSRTLEKADRRLASLKSINSRLDLGDGATIDSFKVLIEHTRTQMEYYNTLLSSIDAAKTSLVEAEKSLAELSEKMLIGVAFKYGKDSQEYQMAGGTRKSDRKRVVRQPTATANASS
ncbi:hypothetical protein [Myxacorys almedinensis]|uniref:Uncharacterized protein n=1 Tax=Myxacorys almedinensis A TaxID=2690445 RepID=A0A8J7Z2A5_9CYAN|nr:hypothetical protein [Myxacorys almedinensis]NDJ16838.1 hypothetical protein [Myxacorys almedinensis A]